MNCYRIARYLGELGLEPSGSLRADCLLIADAIPSRDEGLTALDAYNLRHSDMPLESKSDEFLGSFVTFLMRDWNA